MLDLKRKGRSREGGSENLARGTFEDWGGWVVVDQRGERRWSEMRAVSPPERGGVGGGNDRGRRDEL